MRKINLALALRQEETNFDRKGRLVSRGGNTVTMVTSITKSNGKTAQLKLADIAYRINAHLKRFEADPKINRRDDGGVRYWVPYSWHAGSYVGVRYVNYQGDYFLTKAEALRYLAWLNAGNVGTHYKMERIET